MWDEVTCQQFFKRTLGLELDNQEARRAYDYLKNHAPHPLNRHGTINVAFSPKMLIDLINAALERAELPLQNPRFKKIAEEIFPAIYLVLCFKKVGLGEFLIVSRDAPDIVLVDFKKGQVVSSGNRIPAIPLEAVYISDRGLTGIKGISASEKVANFLFAKKFRKRYESQTILLATLNAGLENLDLHDLGGRILMNAENPFHQIWMFMGLESGDCVIAQLYPESRVYKLNVEVDLKPLLF